MTEEELRALVDLTDAICPHCGKQGDRATYSGREASDHPRVGDPTICGHCVRIGIFEEASIRKATDEEIANLERFPEFHEARTAASFLATLNALDDDPDSPSPMLTVDVEVGPHVGSPHGHPHRTRVVPIGPEGLLLNLDNIPPELMQMFRDKVQQAHLDMVAEQVRKFITPEVAHNVLSVYGEEGFSFPSLSVGALIGLIRTCQISDEVMLDTLNLVGEFHGYVLAVMLMDDDPTGPAQLRAIAGMDKS